MNISQKPIGEMNLIQISQKPIQRSNYQVFTNKSIIKEIQSK
jgi:hypothetical protein